MDPMTIISGWSGKASNNRKLMAVAPPRIGSQRKAKPPPLYVAPLPAVTMLTGSSSDTNRSRSAPPGNESNGRSSSNVVAGSGSEIGGKVVYFAFCLHLKFCFQLIISTPAFCFALFLFVSPRSQSIRS